MRRSSVFTHPVELCKVEVIVFKVVQALMHLAEKLKKEESPEKEIGVKVTFVPWVPNKFQVFFDYFSHSKGVLDFDQYQRFEYENITFDNPIEGVSLDDIFRLIEIKVTTLMLIHGPLSIDHRTGPRVPPSEPIWGSRFFVLPFETKPV